MLRSALAFAMWSVAAICSDGESAPTRGTDWWSMRPIERPHLPDYCSEWARTPVDTFIEAKLSTMGLRPSPEADAQTLIRRLTYDLHGLPPTPAEISDFVNDGRADAYERLVDRLLDSPRYGERWGRHWLDVVHFGETHGYDKDKPRLNAWPYRDYVIRSLNNDKAYGRFVEEQLAGDVIAAGDPDGVVATGFIAAGPWDFVGHVELPETKTDGLIARYNDRDDMVSTTMSTFVSLTVHCARCHDHKFDPITQRDYYRLQAVFAGVDRADRPYDCDVRIHLKRQSLAADRTRLEKDLRLLEEPIARITSPALEELDRRLADLKAKLARLPEKSDSQDRRSLEAEVAQLAAVRQQQVEQQVEPAVKEMLASVRGALEAVKGQLAQLPTPRLVFAATADFARQGSFAPAAQPRPVHLLNRGDVKQPGMAMTPGSLECVAPLSADFQLPDPDNESARRAALARWITDGRNPLTWRSIVNRVWQYHFGRGIVDTPNDFGRMGDAPSHPELLDWLAAWFLDNGQSLKALHRLILTSSVYRQTSISIGELRIADSVPDNPQSSATTVRQAFSLTGENIRQAGKPDVHFLGSNAPSLDSDNRYLWRMNRTRLDAESIRDSALYVAGRLDLTMEGPSVQHFVFKDDHSPVYDYSRFDVDTAGSFRRSIYRFTVRSVPDPFMECLDCPDASLLTPKRNSTLTALQALSMLNDRVMVRAAECLAERVTRFADDLPGRIAVAYQFALGRLPRPDELNVLCNAAAEHGLVNTCRVILNSNEFVFID